MIAIKTNRKARSSSQGVRPLDLRRDVNAVSTLLETVFHQHIGRAGRQALAPGALDTWLRFGRNAAVPGFVFVIDKKIVGNVSLLQSTLKGRYLVANVAVHPDFRRRGIARKMMNQVIEYVGQRQGTNIVLQVEENNLGAVNLYRSLRFHEVGTAVIWHMSHFQLRPIAAPQTRPGAKPDGYDGFSIDILRGDDWQAAYDLDQATFPLDMQWPEPATPNTYQTGFWKNWLRFLNGQQQEVWTAKTAEHELVGLAAIEMTWGRPHVIRLRLDPAWAGRVARPLLAKLLRRLRYHSRRPILIDQLKGDELLESLLKEAGFQKRRTLTTMKHLIVHPEKK